MNLIQKKKPKKRNKPDLEREKAWYKGFFFFSFVFSRNRSPGSSPSADRRKKHQHPLWIEKTRVTRNNLGWRPFLIFTKNFSIIKSQTKTILKAKKVIGL